MFSTANTLAMNFTFPVIISYRRFNGECGSSIGTFVVINEDGWFVTAKHIVELLAKLQQDQKNYSDLVQKREAIQNNTGLKKHVQMQQLQQLKIPPTSVTNFSVWPGWDGIKFGRLLGCENIDLAAGQLLNFNKTLIKKYPEFKDPNKQMSPGSSLCKLGFPFHSITPTYDNGRFVLPQGSLPIPLFPIEGIYTRKINIEPPKPFPFPLSYIETSTPGLKGQSGGPTFDINGDIWAIQSMTQHYHLGFGNQADKSKASEHLQHQYLNVGWGVHSETIVGFLTQNKVSFKLSTR